MGLALFDDEPARVVLCFPDGDRLYVDLNEPEMVNNGFNSYIYRIPVVVDKAKADPLIQEEGRLPVRFACGRERDCYPCQVVRYRGGGAVYEPLYVLKPW